KMKKLYLILMFALCFAFTGGAYAQRYLPGQRGLQITAGTVNGFNLNTKSDDFAFHVGTAYSTYTKNGNRWVLGGEFMEKCHSYKKKCLPQAQFTAEGGYYLKFLSDASKTLFLSLGTSALGGYETVNWNKKLLSDGATIKNKDAFLYGAALTLEAEIYLADRVVLLANVRERLLAGSSVGKFNTQVAIGIKWIIN
ncbi:hypothetical protein EZS27_037435, partial [termite gut metagenome]